MITAFSRAVASCLLVACGTSLAQTTQPGKPDAAYETAIGDRADKIVATLDLDSDKAAAVKTILLRHYRNLKTWDAETGPKLKALQAQLNDTNKADDTTAADRIKSEMGGIRGTKTPMHDQFIRDLVRTIPFTKVNAIKDAMTYNNVRIRFGAMEKLGLTDEQRVEIRDMLVATRELAMDAGTSDEKATMFLETVGRISLRVLTPEQNAQLKALQRKPAKPATSQP